MPMQQAEGPRKKELGGILKLDDGTFDHELSLQDHRTTVIESSKQLGPYLIMFDPGFPCISRPREKNPQVRVHLNYWFFVCRLEAVIAQLQTSHDFHYGWNVGPLDLKVGNPIVLVQSVTVMFPCFANLALPGTAVVP